MKVSLPMAPLLGLTFIILKLCSVIAWSWWWVLAPFWIPLAVAFLAATVILIIALIGGKKPWLN